MRDEGESTFWQRLRQQLWQPPRAHGEQPQERPVGPLELFYDLVVVVLVAQAAHHLAGELTWRGVGEYAAVFGLSRICAAAAVACLGVGAVRPAPIVLGLVLVVLFSIPWGFAVAYRLRRSEAIREQPVG